MNKKNKDTLKHHWNIDYILWGNDWAIYIFMYSYEDNKKSGFLWGFLSLGGGGGFILANGSRQTL